MTLKDHILAALEANRQSALSGQALAEQFAVSRNAVWKAVNALKAEGYDIESTQNKGYRLAPDCDRFSEAVIRANLNGSALPIAVFDTVDSTSNEVKRRLAAGERGPFLVVAEQQSAGRGRLGRSFFSPVGAGLYMTIALAPGMAVEGALGVTAYAAVCVSDAIERVTGRKTQIKWVNDLFLDGKKICGILTEAVTDFESGTLEALAVGIGINLRPSAVPEDLRDIVGSLNCDEPVKNRLTAAIAEGMMNYSPEDTGYYAEYRRRSWTIGKRVRCAQGEQHFIGRAVAIDDHGALIVEAEDGQTHVLRSGEAKIIPGE
ncbi:MAG: biotin--[acetyl-CoA-carboxylase] ligase [Eubacteriales bacterium]|nr:biotin--[acetyl-CoA-carboxylase] ligase [Eubacteriales bacterium]